MSHQNCFMYNRDSTHTLYNEVEGDKNISFFHHLWGHRNRHYNVQFSNEPLLENDVFAEKLYTFSYIFIFIFIFEMQIQLNPFRQPMAVEESPLFIPCYSNCFIFAM